MPWGHRARYCCINVPGRCPHALNDTLFSHEQYEAWGGQCRGNDDRPGCGEALVPGTPDDQQLRWIGLFVLAVAIIASVAMAMGTYIFPPQIKDVIFVSEQSRIAESDGRTVVKIRRTAGLNARVELETTFVDGSAKAGIDYETPNHVIVLDSGQSEAQISIPLLPDTTRRKGERHFSVVLRNVLGRPSHVIVITPKPVDVTTQEQVRQMVLGVSRIAADIAGYVVKIETMEHLMRNYRDRDAKFKEYWEQLKVAGENLVRAREAYLQAIRGLQVEPSQQVLETIDRLRAELVDRKFRQQAGVLPIVGQHFKEIANGKSADMDRWVKELGETIERVPSGAERPPNIQSNHHDDVRT